MSESKLDRNSYPQCLKEGNRRERLFLGILFGNRVRFGWNPERVIDPWAIDLEVTLPADLKSQWEPFRPAPEYGFRVESAVTINTNDYHKYSTKSPNCMVVWWLKHSNVERFVYANFFDLQLRIERPEFYARSIPLHQYRSKRTGQAKACYVFDADWFPYLIEKPSCEILDETLARFGMTREQWEEEVQNAADY